MKGDRDALALAEATEELNSAVCSPSTSTFSTAPPNVVAPASPLQSLSPSSSVQTRKESPSGHKHVVEPCVSGSVEPSVSSVPSSHSCSVSPLQAALLRRGLWASSLSPEAASFVPSVSAVVRPPSPSPAFPPDDVFFRQEWARAHPEWLDQDTLRLIHGRKPPSPSLSFQARCQFHVGPQFPCKDCVVGTFVCSKHFVPCQAERSLVCPACQRTLCRRHESSAKGPKTGEKRKLGVRFALCFFPLPLTLPFLLSPLFLPRFRLCLFGCSHLLRVRART